jgi:hypothetical protein
MDCAEHSYKEVGKIVGVSDSTVASWYRGDSLPFSSNMRGIQRYLGGQTEPPTQGKLPLQPNGRLRARRVKEGVDVLLVQESGRAGLAEIKWIS